MIRESIAELYDNSILKNKLQTFRSIFQFKDYIVIIVSLVLLATSASFLFEGTNKWVYWLYDDTEHLSVAYNLFHGKGLSRDFIDFGAASTESNIPHLLKYDQISNALRSKPPLHLALLGGWLFIVGANYTNWYFWGSIFNFILGATSIVLFYLFTKRYFGIEIATYATPVLALMPPMIWYSVRIRPDLLAFVFIIAAFYVAAKRITFQNMIFVGVLCGLAHLTHPIGLLPGSALIIYLLLFKRKFRAALVLLGTWALVIVPWMVRNYMIFGDATQGFGLPFPRGMSTALGLASPTVPALSGSDVGTVVGIPINQTIIGLLDELTHLYGMQLFVLFAACSIIAYLSFSKIRTSLSSSYAILFFILSAVTYMGAIRLVLSLNNLIFQFFVFILVPLGVYLGLRFFSRHRNIFAAEGKDIYTILGIFVILNFVIYLMFAQTTGRVAPEVRIIVFGLFMLIPLSIVGIKKVIVAIYAPLVGSPMLRNKIVSLSMVSILFIFSFIQILAGIPSINALMNQFSENDYLRKTHEWIIENIPSDAKFASNLPHAILLRTGHEVVNFPTAFIGNESYERWIVKKFDVDYFVFDYRAANKPVILATRDLDGIEIRAVYRSEATSIYKVIEKDN